MFEIVYWVKLIGSGLVFVMEIVVLQFDPAEHLPFLDSSVVPSLVHRVASESQEVLVVVAAVELQR